MVSTVPELFEAIVARESDAPALVFKDRTLGYRELNARANRLARRLVAHGVGPDTLVALSLPRSDGLVVAVLAVLKAGGAYLPLDPNYPAPRLTRMVEDARPVLMLRTPEVPSPAPGIPELVLEAPEFVPVGAGPGAAAGPGDEADLTDADRLAPLTPDHLMYVIYTSGSTGVPKGVAVPHAGVADMVATQADVIGPGPGDRVLQWASISFDAAFWDLTLALLSGATLVMAEADDILPGQPLRDTLLRHDVTHAVLPPVALSVTDSEGVLVGGTVMSTGDACTETLVREWSAGRRMFNGYGPTEVTVGATVAGPVTDADEVSIGTPWTGNRVYVLDERLREVPEGEEGELYLAGSGQARGYLGRPGVTATRFVPDVAGPPGARMYRSGDRGRRRPDGELVFTGRADNQVKVRGFRIELGEIETRLAQHPDVSLAAVLVEGGLADARVIAYVTAPASPALTGQDLRRFLAAQVPEHMVPSAVLVLDGFPTTSNGKIDRSALRDAVPRPEEPRTSVATLSGGEVAPDEQRLLDLVGEILDVTDVRLDDNFFELGGQSILAASLARRIRRTFEASIPMRSIFEARTLGELARTVRETRVPDLVG
ncbi:non-ribosomal peptide synthetase [Streptomyces sp. NPDC087300]|uniref:non-ribosomal peptide synthetase n=1 Tax=Streptomyces sp. NPDC087300 TaxID=3365780 RepID=UPI0037FCDA56